MLELPKDRESLECMEEKPVPPRMRRLMSEGPDAPGLVIVLNDPNSSELRAKRYVEAVRLRGVDGKPLAE